MRVRTVVMGRSPLDARLLNLGRIKQLRRTVVWPEVELVGPRYECSEFGAGVGQQLSMYAEPGGEREPAVHLVSMRTDLGYRRLPADPRHDPFVAVVERLPAGAVEVAKDVPGRPGPGLLGDAGQLGQCPFVPERNVRDVADREDLRVPGHAQVRAHVDTPAPTLSDAHVARDRGRHLAAGPDGEVGLDGAAISEQHVVPRYLRDRRP